MPGRAGHASAALRWGSGRRASPGASAATTSCDPRRRVADRCGRPDRDPSSASIARRPRLELGGLGRGRRPDRLEAVPLVRSRRDGRLERVGDRLCRPLEIGRRRSTATSMIGAYDTWKWSSGVRRIATGRIDRAASSRRASRGLPAASSTPRTGGPGCRRTGSPSRSAARASRVAGGPCRSRAGCATG